MAKYLDNDGLLYLWGKIKAKFTNVQADWEETDTTSDAYIMHKPNIPSGVVVDDSMSSTSENPVQNKVIYSFVNSSISSAVTGMYKYKGSVATASLLPASGQTIGDVYNIESSSVYGGPGMNVAWNGSVWDPLGEIFTITSITNGEIDTIVAT